MIDEKILQSLTKQIAKLETKDRKHLATIASLRETITILRDRLNKLQENNNERCSVWKSSST